MRFVVASLLLLSAVPAAANDQPQEGKSERKVCKRFEASESRMASKRICKTAAQWRAEGRKDSFDESAMIGSAARADDRVD